MHPHQRERAEVIRLSEVQAGVTGHADKFGVGNRDPTLVPLIDVEEPIGDLRPHVQVFSQQLIQRPRLSSRDVRFPLEIVKLHAGAQRQIRSTPCRRIKRIVRGIRGRDEAEPCGVLKRAVEDLAAVLPQCPADGLPIRARGRVLNDQGFGIRPVAPALS